jgi:riboflavin kinase/FMN adenylyltransferase
MEIIKKIKEFSSLDSSVLTIGSYDGLHKGHISLLKSMVIYSNSNKIPSVLVTFDPHPKQILSEKNKVKLITSFKIKMEMIKEIGIDYVYVINFTYEFSKISAKSFLDNIVKPNFNPKKMYVGFDHHFGNQREGDSNFLLSYGDKNNIEVEIINSINTGQEKISSSRIRELVEIGEIKKANFLLGSSFLFESIVVHGSGRGESLGFPTANIKPLENDQLVPQSGVYLIKGRINGQNTFGMCNLGTRPTFNEIEFVIEVHFFHNSLKDIYGLILKIEFLERIRDEIKFPTTDKLVAQLNLDKQLCLRLKSNYK